MVFENIVSFIKCHNQITEEEQIKLNLYMSYISFVFIGLYVAFFSYFVMPWFTIDGGRSLIPNCPYGTNQVFG